MHPTVAVNHDLEAVVVPKAARCGRSFLVFRVGCAAQKSSLSWLYGLTLAIKLPWSVFTAACALFFTASLKAWYSGSSLFRRFLVGSSCSHFSVDIAFLRAPTAVLILFLSLLSTTLSNGPFSKWMPERESVATNSHTGVLRRPLVHTGGPISFARKANTTRGEVALRVVALYPSQTLSLKKGGRPQVG